LRRLAIPLSLGLLAFAAAATPVLAEDGGGTSYCSESGQPTGYDGDFDPAPNNVGEYVAWITQNVGLSASNNPGVGMPFVPFVIDCNPTAG
jgi:hypothetical protein